MSYKFNVKVGPREPGRSFYLLRRTFETAVGEPGDQVAVDLAMGHVDDSTGAVCREGLSDDRLITISWRVEDSLGPEDPDVSLES